jgi:basic amino acid/polyamine antiporter, APA family
MLNAAPGKTLSALDAIFIIIGVVIGAGIFRTPSIVAANAGSEASVLLVWLAGGAISLIGALCYAELTTSFPNAGGDYHYLFRAYGQTPAFLFAWARMTVIQTGSLAMHAFIIGDYASGIMNLGPYSVSIYAGSTVILLTFINATGIRQGSFLQNGLTTGILLGLGAVFFVGLNCPSVMTYSGLTHSGFSIPDGSGLGKAMIFVLLTYGGWNEAAYLSAELRGSSMLRVLIISTGIITTVYLLVNFVFLRGLGISGMSGTEAVAADLMRKGLGEAGSLLLSILIVFTVLSNMNGTMITGARTNYAVGTDFRLFSFLGKWNLRGGTPINAMLLQGCLAFVLVLLGTATRSGFEAMVEYTAPVFWFFFLLVGISIFVLRAREPFVPRPFRVPLYPLLPFLFCLVCLYMLQSSLAYTGKGALVGIGVLLAGVPLLFIRNGLGKVNSGKEK